MKKILYTSTSVHADFIQHLSDQFEMVAFSGPTATTEDILNVRKQFPEAGGIMLAPVETPKLIHGGDPTSVAIKVLGCCDFILFQEQKMSPMLILSASIRMALVKKVPQIDSTKKVYVYGQNKLSEIFIWTFLDMGFPHIKWILGDDDLISDRLEEMKTHFLGSQIELLNVKKLSDQPTDGVLLVHTDHGSEAQKNLRHLSYFNYLKNNAVIICYETLTDETESAEEPAPAAVSSEADSLPRIGQNPAAVSGKLNYSPEPSLWDLAQAAGLFCISRQDIDLESANHFLR